MDEAQEKNYKAYEPMRIGFTASDTSVEFDVWLFQDGDGLLASRLAVHLLLGRGAGKQSSQMAVAAVDVRGSGASDRRRRDQRR